MEQCQPCGRGNSLESATHTLRKAGRARGAQAKSPRTHRVGAGLVAPWSGVQSRSVPSPVRACLLRVAGAPVKQSTALHHQSQVFGGRGEHMRFGTICEEPLSLYLEQNVVKFLRIDVLILVFLFYW